MSLMKNATFKAITSMMTLAKQKREIAYNHAQELLAAMEILNGASAILENSLFFSDAEKAILSDQIDGLYFDIKSEWKELV